MRKLRIFQKTISLTEGDTQAEAIFPKIPGTILGYNNKIVGTLPPNESCDLVFRDNGQNINDPLDTAVGEITTKTSFKDGIVPMKHTNPGEIKAVAIASAAIGNGEDYKVKVIVYYVEGTTDQTHNATIAECMA